MTKLSTLIIVLLLFVLAGCQPSVIKYGEPTESTKVTLPTDPTSIPSYLEYGIKSTYLLQHVNDAQYTEEDLSIRYYGCYEGAHICFIDGIYEYSPMIKEEVLSGLAFRYPSSQKLMVYKDGDILELKTAYEAGWLSTDALSQLLEYYKTVYGYLFEE